MVSPYSFPEKNWRPFLVIVLAVATPTLSAFQRRLSNVLCKFSRKKLISFGCHHPLDGVLPAVHSSSDATVLTSDYAYELSKS